MESASLHRVAEPELDMSRPIQHNPSEKWRRLIGAIGWLRLGEGMIGRPKRSMDRDHQEFPSSLD